MPLPAPSWLVELQERDDVRRLLEAFQYSAASYWEGAQMFPTKWLATSVEHDRLIAEELFQIIVQKTRAVFRFEEDRAMVSTYDTYQRRDVKGLQGSGETMDRLFRQWLGVLDELQGCGAC